MLYRLAPCKFSAFVRIAIQMSLLSYWYPDTFEFNRMFPNLDHVFASVEQSMFGGQPAVWFCAPFPADVGERAVQYGILLLLSDDSAGGEVWYVPSIVSTFSRRLSFVHRHRFLHLLPDLYLRPRGRAAVLLPRHRRATMWRRVCFPSIGDYFHHHQELTARTGLRSTASSTTWWRVPSRSVSAPRLLFPVRTSECPRS